MAIPWSLFPLEQHKQSEEKFKLLSSEKEESQLKVLTLVKERDDFAQLALQRGKTLEVSNFKTVENKAINKMPRNKKWFLYYFLHLEKI